jgi:hypothetical protein
MQLMDGRERERDRRDEADVVPRWAITGTLKRAWKTRAGPDWLASRKRPKTTAYILLGTARDEDDDCSRPGGGQPVRHVQLVVD